MKIFLSPEKLHQLSLYSSFTCSLHAILKLPGNCPSYATLIDLSGYLAHAICTKRQQTHFSAIDWKTVHHHLLKQQNSCHYASKSLYTTQTGKEVEKYWIRGTLLTTLGYLPLLAVSAPALCNVTAVHKTRTWRLLRFRYAPEFLYSKEVNKVPINS